MLVLNRVSNNVLVLASALCGITLSKNVLLKCNQEPKKPKSSLFTLEKCFSPNTVKLCLCLFLTYFVSQYMCVQ